MTEYQQGKAPTVSMQREDDGDDVFRVLRVKGLSWIATRHGVGQEGVWAS